MVLAEDVKPGTTLQLEGKILKVLEVVRHAGSGQMHGFIELKMKDLRFGHVVDRRLKHSEKLEEANLTKKQMDFLYADEAACYFMDPVSFEQTGVPRAVIGQVERFLKEGMRITVELLGDEPLAIDFPKTVELKVVSTGPGIKGGQDNTLKPAVLDNGMEILVPQFIETGEMVRVDTEKGKYIDRVPLRHL